MGGFLVFSDLFLSAANLEFWEILIIVLSAYSPSKGAEGPCFFESGDKELEL